MPQIEEVQLVWWGPFRPDTIPLAVDGINVATGPNGSGKTAFLDAIKLLLGTDQLKAPPTTYIYGWGIDDPEDGETPVHRAQRALLRAVFANPDRGGGQGRVFADAGRGCENAEYVTAICEVTRDRRRYLLRAGRTVWGGHGRDLRADIDLLQAIPASHWLRPRQWQGLMARAGISRSLVQLMSMGQGETDKAIHGTPEQLLRRALELTGRQEIIDNFRETKKGLDAARAAHRQASERFRGEEQQLALLDVKVQRHREYREGQERLHYIERLELPVARHRAAAARLDAVRAERDGTARNVETLQASVNDLDQRIPELEAQLREHEQQASDLRRRADEALRVLSEAASRHGVLSDEHQRLIADLQAGAAHHDGPVDKPLVAAAGRDADDAAVYLRRLREELDTVEQEVETLTAGRPVPPAGLEDFRRLLSEQGITSELVAEQLEADHPAAEAALHDGVWALVVPEQHFDATVELAVQQGHRLPIVRAGEGQPHGALAGARGLPAAGAYLREVSLPLDQTPGVRADGLVQGEHWAAWRRPQQPILGEQARRAALEAAQLRLAELGEQLPDAGRASAAARERAAALAAALEAVERMPQLERDLAAAAAERDRADQAAEELQAELASQGKAGGQLEATLGQLRLRRQADERQLTQSQRRLTAYEQQISQAHAEIHPLSDEQQQLADVASVDALERERDRLCESLDDEARYPPELRSELILVERDDHARRVQEIGGLLEGRDRDLREVTEEVDRARERYTQHIRQVVDLIGRRFRELCERAGMEGQLQLVPSAELEGELGLELKVAHVRGQRMLSARHPHHSGGQRVKMAILLLLASMGVEGATDLLIMDEHSAHLDSRNIDHVAELMNQLKGQVQFILAMPSHAEALRLAWCDHQLAFYLRSADELYSPPIRLLTRLPDTDEARYLHMGQLPLAN